ncbi:zinc transporter ZIP6 [Teleopsis dalmanni]|uniref:zinc transporter ZIP6 n=1 Tax=Teleopsis dalmanni TaxID=139649 RepID=UPI0018CE0D73|nr:zinc transporter ZIP6 [Teleopsis dalmanni]
MLLKNRNLCFLLLLIGGFHFIDFAETATEYNRYLAHIFRKYGNGGTMTFEGLEHLMYNLGLGQLEFDPTHTIDEHHSPSFQQKPENDLELKNYIEQNMKLLPNDVDDIQLTESTSKSKTSSMSADTDNSNKEDTDVKERIAREKGILLEFKEMHDPKHRHPRENDATFDGPVLSSNVCLSPKSLLRLVIDHEDIHKRKLYKTVTSSSFAQDKHSLEDEYNEFINMVKLTPLAFMKLCPALLAQIDQHVCVRPAPLTHIEDSSDMIWNAWIYATGSIFLLSACGLLGILLVPLMKTVAYQEILKFLIAVAIGTLSGDALMHLLPHALVQEHEPAAATAHESGEGHHHDTTAVLLCGCAFATAVFMYIIETILPILKGESEGHGHSHGGHGHSHSQTKPQKGQNETSTTATTEQSTTERKEIKEINMMLNEMKKDEKSPSKPLTPVAFMVVIGDGLHNLTDGLAIGAAFATDPVTGMATAFAVLCHELPHELGDFALLLQTGVSLRRAVCLNIVSSVLSFVGMAIGLLIANLHSNMTQWIYAGTAGSFLYIAFADLIPAMGSAHGKPSLKDALITVLGIITGGLIMLVIALNEDDLEVLFK